MLAASLCPSVAQQAETLGRGLVAVKTKAGVYLSWRCLTSDKSSQGYDVYRDGVKVNAEPITGSTNYVDASGTADAKYVVKAVDGGQVVKTTPEAAVWPEVYKKVHLDRPAGGTTPDGVAYTYSPNDCSVGDVDGDGEYEIIVKWDPSNSKDNSEKGAYTGNVYIDGYKIDGTKLWRIDLGRNIRAGAHYTQFMVYDLDGDGKAEVACKTAPGTIDGQKPSLVMCRGYYTASYLCAWDFDGKNLTQRWLHKSETAGEGIYGEGAHALTVGDVDGDGCDEIVYGAACVDHDGSVLYRTGAGHGDALHLGDFDPDHDGLEIWMVHEEKSSAYPWDAEFRDAKTGEILWGQKQSGNDIGRGVVADVSEKWRGCEAWAIADYTSGSKATATYDCKGNKVADKRPSCNFRIYWDGDLYEELLDGTDIVKRNATLTSDAAKWSLGQYSNAQSCNTSKKTPCLSADILGDWREEVILWDGSTSSDLLIFTTTEETKYKVPCLMQDHIYRMAIAWQNVAYNQPPHLGYYLPDRFSTDASMRAVSGQLNQTVEQGEAIEAIVYEWKNATGVAAEGLPEGVTMSVDNSSRLFTISGTPSATGTYKYKVSTTGGETTATIEGTITVRDKIVLTPLACYPFDEISAGSTPNTVEGMAEAVGAPASVQGIKGNAAQLDGASYFTQMAYSQIQLGTEDFTVEFWMKSADDAAYIFHKGSITANAAAGATGKWVGLEYKNGLLKFAVDDNVTKSEASAAGTAYFNGEWTHIVCVRDSYTKTLKLYANGVLIAEAADATGDISDNDEPLTVGNVNVSFNNFLEGTIDEFTIYKGAMSSNKVKERYNEFISSGIETVPSVHPADKLTLVSATSGIVVARGVGAPENITSGVAPGYYILIIDHGTSSEVRKFVKK